MTRSKLMIIVMVSTIALLTLLVSVVFSQDGSIDANAVAAQEAPNIPLPPMTNPARFHDERLVFVAREFYAQPLSQAIQRHEADVVASISIFCPRIP